MIILSFDFGKKNIGVAVGQNITKNANILNNIKVINGKPDWNRISFLIKEWKPNFLIVGLPLNMDGSEQILSFHSRVFAKNLYKNFKIEVKLHDERLTSVEARETLFYYGGFRFLNTKNIHGLSAVLILESWLRKN